MTSDLVEWCEKASRGGGEPLHRRGPPAGTQRVRPAAALADNAFVAADPALLAEALCIEEEPVVPRDNTVTYGRRTLQLPASPARAHYVKARAKVREYPDGHPRRIPRHTAYEQDNTPDYAELRCDRWNKLIGETQKDIVITGQAYWSEGDPPFSQTDAEEKLDELLNGWTKYDRLSV